MLKFGEAMSIFAQHMRSVRSTPVHAAKEVETSTASGRDKRFLARLRERAAGADPVCRGAVDVGRLRDEVLTHS